MVNNVEQINQFFNIVINYYSSTDKNKTESYKALQQEYLNLTHSAGLYIEGKEQRIKAIEQVITAEHDSILIELKNNVKKNKSLINRVKNFLKEIFKHK